MRDVNTLTKTQLVLDFDERNSQRVIGEKWCDVHYVRFFTPTGWTVVNDNTRYGGIY